MRRALTTLLVVGMAAGMTVADEPKFGPPPKK
jgi:hypothetical protein